MRREVEQDGGIYDPVQNAWTALPTAGAPSARECQAAVWTGSDMIIWGGDASGYFGDGARYNPGSNVWVNLATNNAPQARTGLLRTLPSVWTGSEMIVWGGWNGGYLNTGGRYNPSADAWTAVQMNGAPPVRQGNAGVWTGNNLLIWGGEGGPVYNDTWSYTPGKLMYLYLKP